MGQDAGGGPKLEVRWLDRLQGAARMWAGGDLAIAEFDPSTYEAPAPRELRAVRTGDAAVIAEDHGWILRSAPTADAVLVVDEGERELSYGVRRFGEPTTKVMSAPDNAAWVIRAAVCGDHVPHCALVRWSPRPGERVAAGGVERLGITVIDASTLGVERHIVVEVADLLAGSARLGGVVANPIRSEVYVIERSGDEGAVRAIDLTTGKTQWRTELEEAPARASPDRDLEVTVSGDGRYLVVGRGQHRWDSFELRQLQILDSGSGAPLAARPLPDGWRYVLFMPVPARPEILVARIGAIRGTGESPTFSFLGIARLDPTTGGTEDVYDPAAGASTDEDREKARWKTPQRGLATGTSSVTLVPIGSSGRYPRDLTPIDRQQQRAAAVAALAELSSP